MEWTKGQFPQVAVKMTIKNQEKIRNRQSMF